MVTSSNFCNLNIFLTFLCNCFSCFITARITFTSILYLQCIYMIIYIIYTSFQYFSCRSLPRHVAIKCRYSSQVFIIAASWLYIIQWSNNSRIVISNKWQSSQTRCDRDIKNNSVTDPFWNSEITPQYWVSYLCCQGLFYRIQFFKANIEWGLFFLSISQLEIFSFALLYL